MSKQWMRLDNAALIFPAVRRPKWVNVFRVSLTLTHGINPSFLQQAVNELMPRFPGLYVRLRAGLFWYYLEESQKPPTVHTDYAYPLTHMSAKELHTCCLRVLYYKNRIAVECFHALTDGTGGMTYLKTLVARYIELSENMKIPAENGVLDWQQPPQKEELEDSFLKNAAPVALSRTEPNAWHMKGTREPGDFLHLTCGVCKTSCLLDAAHRYNATLTVYLTAVMLSVLLEMEKEKVIPALQKAVKVTVPINLRRLFHSRTLRNFVLTVNPGADPRLGDYTIQELCDTVAHQLAVENTPQQMRGRIAANVGPQRSTALRLSPLFIKNAALRLVYASVGETKSCLNISNMGAVNAPENMKPYVTRADFIIGVQYTYPNNCSVASFGETTCINMIRNIKESELEQRFFCKLVEENIPVTIESNEKRNC